MVIITDPVFNFKGTILLKAYKDKRNFYEREAVNLNWSVRELKRQINTLLYERLLLSKGEVNRQDGLRLATNGIHMLS